MGPDPLQYHGTALLPQKKTTHQKNIGVPAESYMAQDPQCNDDRHRHMYGEEPLDGEARGQGP